MALRRGQAEIASADTKTKSKTKPGDLFDWLKFFLKSMQKQKLAPEAKMKDELEAAKLPPLSLQIIEFIKSRGPTSIGEAVAATGANRNTAKVHLKNLVEDGHLQKEGVGRGMRYWTRY